ncbi:MAG: Pyruvate synthase subunit PorC [candidate division WS2 bacterium]|nr:Pyruvate synthase subunit PorC [Candidatus Lithacetigena glycinireducens]MBT9175137.1 Pyruvate synthase subunit PorC [Candidatus Lithacetigena glycinireducens]
MIQQFRFAGTGGQGIGVMGVVFAEAGVLEGKEVAFSQSYGPEARGGASRTDVIISDSYIYYPRVTEPDFMVILSQASFDRYVKKSDSNCITIVDASIDTEDGEGISLIKVAIIDTTLKEFKKPVFSNFLALGVLVKVSQSVSCKSLEEAVKRRMGGKYLIENLKALSIGFELINK